MNAVTDTKADHGDILGALATAMGQVQKIAKESRNKHDGYNFASIDDFLALVNPICAENGLIVHMQEAGREDFERQGRNGTSAWMRQSFDITLYHTTGQSLPPVTRTVEVLRNGAQAYGSAQSYALKQFWRCTLLIPTGDKDDADHQPTDAGTITRQPKPETPKAKPATITAEQFIKLRDKAEAAGVDEAAICQPAGCDNMHEVPADRFPAIMKGLETKINSLPKQEASPPANTDLGGDSIPY